MAVVVFAIAGLTAPAHAVVAGPGSITDPTGDVVNDVGAPIANPRADLVAAGGTYRSGQIQFTAAVADPADPRLDPNWADGASVVAWLIDVTGDDDPEYMASVGVVGGNLTAVLSQGAQFDQPVSCALSPAYSLASLSVALPASCIGSPGSFKWGVIIGYDTSPVDPDPDAPIVFDAAPNGDAMAGPVTKRSGYWMVGSDGAVYPFGDAQKFLGTAPSAAVDIEPSPSGSGYWVLAADGRVFSSGDAGPFMPVTLASGEKAVSLSANPTGSGYWIVTDKGRVITRGDAQFIGDMSSTTLNSPVLGSVATPSGKGYWMVASDGGIFSFGDAEFAGSMGDKPLNKPVMSMAPDPDGHGYWLVASDGGIFAFDAPFYGSMGGTPLNKPISGMVPGRGGYLMVAQDGGIFAFGNVAFHGSLGGHPPANPVVAVALLQ